MICIENIHRITKYLLFSVIILFHLSFARDEIELSLENEEGTPRKPPRRHLLYSKSSSMNVERMGDDDEFLRFSASRTLYSWEGTSSPGYQQNIGYKSDGMYYKTVFFVVLGIGLAIFLGLLIVCNRVATVFEDTNTSPVAGATVHPPNSRATYNLRVPDEIGISVSYVNSAYSSGPIGGSEVDRSGPDRPPDYFTVASNDAIHRNVVFPQVVTTHMETPPPKYEDGAPAFR